MLHVAASSGQPQLHPAPQAAVYVGGHRAVGQRSHSWPRCAQAVCRLADSYCLRTPNSPNAYYLFTTCSLPTHYLLTIHLLPTTCVYSYLLPAFLSSNYRFYCLATPSLLPTFSCVFCRAPWGGGSTEVGSSADQSYSRELHYHAIPNTIPHTMPYTMPSAMP